VHAVDGALFGYELLFRDSMDARMAIRQGDEATTATILAAFSDFAPAQLLDGRRGLVNLTRAFLTGELPVPFGPEEAILEVMPDTPVDDALIAGVRSLADAGYLIALDDFRINGPTEPLLPLAHLIKVNVLGRSWAEVAALGEEAVRLGVTAVAERVESLPAVNRCLDAGYTLFQGYRFSLPATLSTPTLDTGRANALRLLAKLADPQVNVKAVEEVLRGDPALTYRLLKATNSASSGLTREISTIRDAVVIVGMTRLKAWAALLAFVGGHPVDMTTALVRARACELLAQQRDSDASDAAFTVGLLNGLAHGMGLSSDRFLSQMPPLAPDLVAALTHQPGRLTHILDQVTRYEDGIGDPVDGDLAPAADGELSRVFLAAWSWATQTSQAVWRGDAVDDD
jgi:EAL and modified HD-GYP domain-containing signal transduction protein